MVGVDHFLSWHGGYGNVGDVAFQPDQLFRSGQRFLVEDSGAFAGGHEPWVAGGLLTGHDGPGLVLLRGEGSTVVECTFVAVVPYSPPRMRIPDWIPNRFGPFRNGVGCLGPGGFIPRGDRVDQLSVSERVPHASGNVWRGHPGL